MVTTDDLRAMPGWVPGWPIEPGWYAGSVGDVVSVRHVFVDHGVPSVFTGWSTVPVSDLGWTRHAPLRLETGATAQAEMALHLAGFEGSILDAVGAALDARDKWRGAYFASSREAAALRAIVAQCATAIGNGSGCAIDASLEFMRQVPTEIAAETASLRAHVAALDECRAGECLSCFGHGAIPGIDGLCQSCNGSGAVMVAP